MGDELMVKRAINPLIVELASIEATRFINIPFKRRIESYERK